MPRSRPTTTRVLRIRACWGETTLGVWSFSPPRSFIVGADIDACDFALDCPRTIVVEVQEGVVKTRAAEGAWEELTLPRTVVLQGITFEVELSQCDLAWASALRARSISAAPALVGVLAAALHVAPLWLSHDARPEPIDPSLGVTPSQLALMQRYLAAAEDHVRASWFYEVVEDGCLRPPPLESAVDRLLRETGNEKFACETDDDCDAPSGTCDRSSDTRIGGAQTWSRAFVRGSALAAARRQDEDNERARGCPAEKMQEYKAEGCPGTAFDRCAERLCRRFSLLDNRPYLDHRRARLEPWQIDPEEPVRPTRPLHRKPRVPSLHAEEPTINGRLQTDVIQRIVGQNFGRFRACYDEGVRTNPDLAGRVLVKFVIDRSGDVAVAQDRASDLPDQSVVRCVVRAFQNLSFPKPAGGIVTVVYPIVFGSSE